MPTLEIIRVSSKSPAQPTLGVLLFGGIPKMVTLELPYLDNQANISCIPEGKYKAVLTQDRHSHSGMVIPLTLEVLDVPGRSGILFHIGNYLQDTQGCILVGMEFGNESIAYSRTAMDKFEDLIFDVKEWDIIIRQA